MNKYVWSETNQNIMKLMQIGAHVTVISSQLVYVSFDITEEIKVSYVYNINKKNKYFLERVKPYPIAVMEFNTPEDICDIIRIDVEQFKNAVKSHNIKDCIGINKDLHNTILSFEDLFLYYNVNHDNIETIKHYIQKIKEEIHNSKEHSERVFFEKDPDHLD